MHRFLGLDQYDPQSGLILPQSLCSPRMALYGGAGLALSIALLEEACAKPLVWATTQFIGQAAVGSCLQFTPQIDQAGHNFCQASLRASSNGEPFLATMASLGAKPSQHALNRNPMPQDIPPPDACAASPMLSMAKDFILGQFDMRSAKGPAVLNMAAYGEQDAPREGPAIYWAKLRNVDTISAASLAILSDMAPSITSPVLGEVVIASSLDNSIRIMHIEQSEWVLCETDLHTLHHGVGHTTTRMWSEQGTLLAVASQSFILRPLQGGFFAQAHKAATETTAAE